VGGREQQRRRLPVCARVKHGNIPIYRYSCYTVHEAPKKFRRHSKFTSSQTCDERWPNHRDWMRSLSAQCT
jgi:hypothetical protein